ncbi:hypothetical protein SAMN02745157_1605 [Kaistia soli DSM 19436]|uniref:Uncharacterized protein n=1 Tax=Kaistia soli DSM 19436 TaxID=1122133 RepID=A0A1M4YSK6_9HYPH|nr:hypothetical protein [Kaistia soli]SHF08703.1 hypothetical protein SAMN02745157_1605 [Kaistia soli DSM 19436]
MPLARLPPPFRQGNLDTLCGLYAILNAIKLALGSETSTLSRRDWQRLFRKLLREADHRVGLVHATSHGVDAAPLRKLIAAADKHLAKRHGLRLIVERPFRASESVAFKTLERWLAEVLDERGSAVIVGLGGAFDHWTTAHRLTADYLCFYDSAGINRVRLDRCRREQIVDGPSLLRIRLAPSSA